MIKVKRILRVSTCSTRLFPTCTYTRVQKGYRVSKRLGWLPLAVVQYFFELAKHRHDHRVDAEPYMRTSHPVLKKLQEKCTITSCKKAVNECYEEGGGSLGCMSVENIPRNRKQAYNLNYDLIRQNGH